MSTKKDVQRSCEGNFRFLRLIPEFIAWLQIGASPLLIGLILGSLIYFSAPSANRLIIGISVAVIGLIVGIIWASKQWKGKGAVWFMSRIIATPELDNPDGDMAEKSTAKDRNSKR